MFNFFKKEEEKVIDKIEVKETTDYSDVTKIAYYFKDETGVSFDNQIGVLKNKVITFCKQRDISSFSKLLIIIDTDAFVKQELVNYLTTNETFFYREFKQIEELALLVQSSSGHIDILCAPSATGEEPYSIAIALLEAGIASSRFKIVGIDINSQALDGAKEAIYRERNVRNLSKEVISRYFEKNDDLYSLKNSVKSLVTYKLANLFDSSFKTIGKFDFIFCRNMLIYFDKETKIEAKNILESMRKSDKHKIFFGHADLF